MFDISKTKQIFDLLFKVPFRIQRSLALQACTCNTQALGELDFVSSRDAGKHRRVALGREHNS